MLYLDQFHFDNATGQALTELTLENLHGATTEEQLEHLIREMEALTERMEALQRSILEPPEAEAAGGDPGDAPAGSGEGE